MAHQSRGTPRTPDQAWSTRTAGELREEAGQDLVQRLDGLGLRAAVVVRAGGVAVGDAAAAEGDAVVRRALGVHVGVGHVAEGFAALPADRLPLRRRQRLRGDHGGVHGEPGAALALEGGGEALRAAQDVGRADGAVGRDGVLRLDLGDGGRLVDRDAEGFDGFRQALEEFHRVQAGAVRGPGRADGADADAVGGLAGAVQGAVLLTVGEFRFVEGLEARQLGGGVRDFEYAAVVDVRVDGLGAGHVDDLGDGLVHGLLEADRSVVAVQFGVAVAARDAVVEPAAVAARGSVAAELLFKDRDPQERGGLLQVVRRPQARVSTADDDDVGARVAGQGVAGERDAVVRVPERYAAVDGAGGVARATGAADAVAHGAGRYWAAAECGRGEVMVSWHMSPLG